MLFFLASTHEWCVRGRLWTKDRGIGGGLGSDKEAERERETRGYSFGLYYVGMDRGGP